MKFIHFAKSNTCYENIKLLQYLMHDELVFYLRKSNAKKFNKKARYPISWNPNKF